MGISCMINLYICNVKFKFSWEIKKNNISFNFIEYIGRYI